MLPHSLLNIAAQGSQYQQKVFPASRGAGKGLNDWPPANSAEHHQRVRGLKFVQYFGSRFLAGFVMSESPTNFHTHCAANFFKRYARSGSEIDLVNLTKVCFIIRIHQHVKVDSLGRKALEKCIGRLLTDKQPTNRLSVRAWNCFHVLLGTRTYESVKKFKKDFRSYPDQAYDTMLMYTELAISESDDEMELNNAFEYLGLLIRDGHRTDLRRVCNNVPLRTTLLAYINEKFTSVPGTTQAVALRVMRDLVMPETQGEVPGDPYEHMWPLLREGGLRILVAAALDVIRGACAGGERASLCIQGGANALYNALYTVGGFSYQRRNTGVDEEFLRLPVHDLNQVAVVLYDLFSIAWDADQHVSILRFAFAFILYLPAYYSWDTATSVLLYQPERVTRQMPLVALLRKVAVIGTASGVGKSIEEMLKTVVSSNPTVAAALAAAVEKDRHCAFPGCKSTSGEGETQHKKCSRCRAVYYCGVEHQREHWPVHKQRCVKAATTAEK